MGKKSLLLCTLALAYGCGDRGRPPECTIVLLAPRSGTQAAIGSQIGRARALVEEELRANGDMSLVIRELDTEGEPRVARAEVERAIERWQTPLVVGSILSTETREFLEPALAKGVVVLANGSSDPTIRGLPFRRRQDGFFRNWPADDAEGRAMAEYLRGTERARKLAVFHANDVYARALIAAFLTRFQELGGEVLGPEVYQTNTTEFEPVLRRLPASDHDGYYVVGLPPDLAGMYNAIRRSPNGADMPVFTAVAAETAEFKSLVRGELTGLFYTAPAVDQASAAYFAFQEAYQRRFNNDSPDIVAEITYDALRIAVAAAKAGKCQPAEIRKYLYDMPPFQGVTGPTAFDDYGDVVTKPVAIRYYERGQLRLAVQTAQAGE